MPAAESRISQCGRIKPGADFDLNGAAVIVFVQMDWGLLWITALFSHVESLGTPRVNPCMNAWISEWAGRSLKNSAQISAHVSISATWIFFSRLNSQERCLVPVATNLAPSRILSWQSLWNLIH